MSKKCIYCGAVLEDEDLFCDECGKSQEKAPDSGEPADRPGNEEKKAKGKIPVVPVAVASAAAVILALSLMGRSFLSSKDTGADSGAVSSQAKDQASSKDSRTDRGSDNGSASQSSATGLLGYIDQAEALYSEAYGKIDLVSVEEEGFADEIRNQREVLEVLVSDLTEVQKQAESVSGIDEKLKTAGTEYFNMMTDSQKAVLEICTFLTDYLDFSEQYLNTKPKAEDYTSTEDYSSAFSTWYQSVKEGYSAIDSCPPCLENRWKRYESVLDLNDSISQKLSQSAQYDDYLRYRSALNMSERYDTVEKFGSGEILGSLKGEMDHLEVQRTLSSNLAEEIRTYTEMEDDERDDYEFEYVPTGKISVSYDTVDTIYPTLYNSYDAFLVIKTGCVSGTKKILVEAEIPGFTQVFKETFALDSACTEIYVKPPVLTGDLDLSAATDAQLHVTISEEDQTLIEEKTFPVTIKSKYDAEWNTDQYKAATKDHILCFLTPESAAISQLKEQAVGEISGITNGQMDDLAGYQDTKWDNHYVGTYLQAAGIMRALCESGVSYNSGAFSINDSNQHILFPEEVLEQKSGLCVETSLVVASALQSAGMHAFLIFPPDHAQVAVEVWDGSGDNTNGTGKYFLIETTVLSEESNNSDIVEENANALLDYHSTGTGPITYYNQDHWREYLTDDTYIIDCDDFDALGLTPFAN